MELLGRDRTICVLQRAEGDDFAHPRRSYQALHCCSISEEMTTSIPFTPEGVFEGLTSGATPQRAR
jgi:hypothetical protein